MHEDEALEEGIAADGSTFADAKPVVPDPVTRERERILGVVRQVLLGQPIPYSLATACGKIEELVHKGE